MDLETVRIFIKVAELSSFTRAAEQLSLPKSRVSTRVAELEAEVGSRLLQRSTRVVRLTPDGELFLSRAHRLVADADELSSLFHAPSGLRGTVRVDAPVNLARDTLIPRLPDFFAAHPLVELQLSTTDRRVDVVREGFDVVLSVGTLRDSGLVTRRLGLLPLVNCVSAGYAQKHGVPRTLGDLDRHQVVHYAMRLGDDLPSFEWVDGGAVRELPMRTLLTVNNADAYRAACLAGLGIIQAPLLGLEPLLATGALVEVLPEHRAAPMPVSLVTPHTRNMPKRVRAVMAWMTQVLAVRLG